MPQQLTVLVLGTEDNSKLINVIFELGLLPLRREKMFTALDKVRHEQFDAIFLDKNRKDVDDLEFILNIRDIGQHMPVIILGNVANTRTRAVIQGQHNVFLLGEKSPDLKNEIRTIIDQAN